MDPALIRPGRLDRWLYCGFANIPERITILRQLLCKVVVDDGLEENEPFWRSIAEKCNSWTGADLAALISNAHLEAIKDVLHTVRKDQTRNSIPKTSSLVDVVVGDSHISYVKDLLPTHLTRQDADGASDTVLPVLAEHHVVRALDSMKPSLSTKDRDMYERIYSEFLGTEMEPRKFPEQRATFV